MKLYAFSDFHLSGDPPTKPMDIFGDNWKNHREKIITSWKNTIRDEDTVIMAGDISWATHMEDALSDLAMIATLPGRKIIVQGNHDYWWDTLSKLKRKTNNQFEFIHNTALSVGNIALAGTRGWIPRTAKKFTEHDEKILTREEGRMQRSIEAAKKLGKDRIIAVLHYPPFDDKRVPTRMMKIMAENGVSEVIYGHIHGKQNFVNLPDELLGIKLHLTSSDYLDFKPLLICDFDEEHM